MAISIVLALISYFLTSRATGGDKKKAAIAALAVGAGSYYATTQTEWGADISKSFDSAIGLSPDPAVKIANDAKAAEGKLTVNSKASGSNGWDMLSSWGAAGTATVAAGAGLGVGAATGKLPEWLPIAALAVGVFLLLK